MTAAAPAEPPATAGALFGARVELARRYAALLAGDGVAHGHLGPREVPRLWERHLLNCAVVTDLVPPGARIVDVGSGAGLPGLPMALRRPDLQVTLLEPMERRVLFLQRCIEELDLTAAVRVVRGRAEEREVRRSLAPAQWVVARAVAPLERLAAWCLPLVAEGGSLLAIKGASVRDEIERGGPVLSSQRVSAVGVISLGETYGIDPTIVARVARAAAARRPAAGARPPTRSRAGRARGQEAG